MKKKINGRKPKSDWAEVQFKDGKEPYDPVELRFKPVKTRDGGMPTGKNECAWVAAFGPDELRVMSSRNHGIVVRRKEGKENFHMNWLDQIGLGFTEKPKVVVLNTTQFRELIDREEWTLRQELVNIMKKMIPEPGKQLDIADVISLDTRASRIMEVYTTGIMCGLLELYAYQRKAGGKGAVLTLLKKAKPESAAVVKGVAQ